MSGSNRQLCAEHLNHPHHPVMPGLPTCEALNMVTINCHVETLERTTKSKPLVTVEDLKVRYPAQFNTVGKFKEPAKIILKHDAEPHIDHPKKCNINLKPKIEVELKKMEK